MKNPFRPATLPAVLLFLAGVGLRPVAAVTNVNDLKGADAVLRETAPLEDAPLPVVKATVSHAITEWDTEVERWLEDVSAFAAARPPAPEEAARAWLELFKRWKNLASVPRYARANLSESFAVLVRCLPPPEAWGRIAEGLRAVPAQPGSKLRAALDAFVALLHNDDATLLAAVDTLESPERAANPAFLHGRLLASTGDAAVATRVIEARTRTKSTLEVNVPDLVGIMGEEKAAALIRKELAGGNPLNFLPAGERTAALARRVALAHIEEMALPQWQLAASLDAGKLFEAMTRRFGERDEADPSFRPFARTCYFLGLLRDGRIDDAVSDARSDSRHGDLGSMTTNEAKLLRYAGRTPDLRRFFERLMAVEPANPHWQNFLNLAVNGGNIAEGVNLLNLVESDRQLPAATRAEILRYPWKLYTRLDHVDLGIRELRGTLREEMPEQPLSEDNAYEMPRFFDHGLSLAEFGRVLHRDDLLNEGLGAAAFYFEQPEKRDRSRPPRKPDCFRQMAWVYESARRPARAEDVLRMGWLQDRTYSFHDVRQATGAFSRTRNNARVFLSQLFADNNRSLRECRDDLVALAGFYDRQGRPADVLALLDRAAGWNARDLGEILTLTDRAKVPLGYTAAHALDALGKQDEARRVLAALLEAGTSHDPAYELFLRLTPPSEALAVFERLAARDPLEARPLIWKAEALKAAGRLDEAEQAARGAIEIDPSDGEATCGLRLRACTTLADVLAAAGKNPEPYRAAVKAIRVAEEADDLADALLDTRAAALYEKALEIYPDAYCIQSRLATRLASLGRTEEARKHFRRACELMPASVGRTGDPCQKCEGFFDWLEARKAAEEVFTKMAAQAGARPQVFYLLGVLRQEERRYPEALDAVRRAVALDPDYLNAWKKFEELSARTHVPRAEQDHALLQILRLDPGHRRSHPKLERLRDFAGLYRTLAGLQGRLAPVDPPCYPLAASAKFVAKVRGMILPPAADAPMAAADGFASARWEGEFDAATLPSAAPEILPQQESMRLLIMDLDAAVQGR